jgi:spore coat polysaccharide biosynthesis protein SpsF (cytidylyltransferase family)
MLALIQARMSSQRLPGKVLMNVDGRPMLAWLVERLRCCRNLSACTIATSVDPSDDPIASLANQLAVPVVRGDLDDVAARFLAASDALKAEAFVRVNGDSPLLDPSLVDWAVSSFAAGAFDIVTNVHPRSYPKGQSVEVMRVAALRQLAMETVDRDDREHVTRYFYRSADRFRIMNFACDEDLSNVQMSVDSPEDFLAFERTAEAMVRPQWEYGFRELVELTARLAPVNVRAPC